MAKSVIKLDYHPEFQITGIVSSIREYRLCWYLNQMLEINLSKQKDIEINLKKKRKLTKYGLYKYHDELNHRTLFLLDNKANGEFFLKEFKQADYFLIEKNEPAENNDNNLLDKIKEIPEVQTAFSVDIKKIKSKENLIFLEEKNEPEYKPRYRKTKHDKL